MQFERIRTPQVNVVSKKTEPKIIPVDKIHVSKTNVRYGLPFGESNEDKALIYQVTWGKKVVQPFKMRPEPEVGEGTYGVFVGRRRFLAKVEAGFREFTEGADFTIEEVDEDEARRQSLVENLDLLREGMDPMTRAHELAKLIDASPGGLRTVAGQLGVAPSTLSEWLKILDLSPKMQETVTKGLLGFTDSLHVAKMDLGEKTQEKLAETLETSGKEQFEKELEQYAEGTLKRGIPKDKYFIVRTLFDRVYPPDMELYKRLEDLAKAENEDISDYCKKVLKTHVEQRKKQAG